MRLAGTIALFVVLILIVGICLRACPRAPPSRQGIAVAASHLGPRPRHLGPRSRHSNPRSRHLRQPIHALIGWRLDAGASAGSGENAIHRDQDHEDEGAPLTASHNRRNSSSDLAKSMRSRKASKRRGSHAPTRLLHTHGGFSGARGADEENALNTTPDAHDGAAEKMMEASFRGWLRRMTAQVPPTAATDVGAILKVIVGYCQVRSPHARGRRHCRCVREVYIPANRALPRARVRRAQVQHVLASFYKVNWPPVFTSFLQALNVEISIDLFLDTSCLLGHELPFGSWLVISGATPCAVARHVHAHAHTTLLGFPLT